jgi:hypothetical protein
MLMKEHGLHFKKLPEPQRHMFKPSRMLFNQKHYPPIQAPKFPSLTPCLH